MGHRNLSRIHATMTYQSNRNADVWRTNERKRCFVSSRRTDAQHFDWQWRLSSVVQRLLGTTGCMTWHPSVNCYQLPLQPSPGPVLGPQISQWQDASWWRYADFLPQSS